MENKFLDTLLSQEMLEVTGGAGSTQGSTCVCISGAGQGPGDRGKCECRDAANQSTDPKKDLEDLKPEISCYHLATVSKP